MTTGCPGCDEVQARTGSRSAMCLQCEDGYQEWIIECARRRRKEIAAERQKQESGAEE